MTLAIEPMVVVGSGESKVLSDGWTVVTSDGKLAAHFEHTIVIQNGAAEVLTRL
jgi:methionyl aminopeptidase